MSSTRLSIKNMAIFIIANVKYLLILVNTIQPEVAMFLYNFDILCKMWYNIISFFLLPKKVY